VGAVEVIVGCSVQRKRTSASAPEQPKMDFHLWSRAAVGQLIEQEFGIQLQVLYGKV